MQQAALFRRATRWSIEAVEWSSASSFYVGQDLLGRGSGWASNVVECWMRAMLDIRNTFNSAKGVGTLTKLGVPG